MSTKYQLTKQIQAIIPLITEKYNKEIQIENYKVLYLDEQDDTETKECIIGSYDNYISDTGYLMTVGQQGGIATTLSHDWIVKIEEPQIRQILLAFFSNWHYKDTDSMAKPMNCTFSTRGQELEKKWLCFRIDFISGEYISYPPLFDTDTIAVLTELLEILTNVLNQ